MSNIKVLFYPMPPRHCAHAASEPHDLSARRCCGDCLGVGAYCILGVEQGLPHFVEACRICADVYAPRRAGEDQREHRQADAPSRQHGELAYHQILALLRPPDAPTRPVPP